MSTVSALCPLPRSAPATARAVFGVLHRMQQGCLELVLPDGSKAQFGHAAEGQPRAVMHLNNWQVFSAVCKSGDIGLAETYIAGDWTTPDLVNLLKLFMVNRDAIEKVVYGTWWGSLWHRLKHLLHRNTRVGSKKNIHAHYDLGNDFYRLWLDPTMNYSSAWFEGDLSGDLSAAQNAKIQRALNECRVKAADRVLEIGCGWGALAQTCAKEFGAAPTGVTLSTEQLHWARERLARQSLPGDIRLQDYRDIDDGPFDAVVSIEMFEAVGKAFWPQFFGAVKANLKRGGRACIQSITIRDDLFDRYVNSTDFIQQYIFPGGLLPSAKEFRRAAHAAGLKVVNELAFGADYAETLRRWRCDFLRNEARVRALGFDTRFMRTWDFYLVYCEAAFATGNTQVVQFTLEA